MPECHSILRRSIDDGLLLFGKFNSLFSFLFGIGFTIQLEWLFARSANPVAIYLRGIGLLLLFGIMHAIFLWTGEVLLIYVLLGALLVLLRKVPDKVILAIVAVGHAGTHRDFYLQSFFNYGAKQEQEDGLLSHEWRLSHYPSLFLTILFGFSAARKSTFSGHTRRCRSAERYSCGRSRSGSGMRFCSAFFGRFIVPFKPSYLNVIVSTAYPWQRPALMLFYASTMVVPAYRERWGRYLALLAPAHRMSAVICTTIFYGYGFGLSFVIYAIQVVSIRWWFEHFSVCPAEWLWRCLMYGKAPSMRGVSVPEATRLLCNFKPECLLRHSPRRR